MSMSEHLRAQFKHNTASNSLERLAPCLIFSVHLPGFRIRVFWSDPDLIFEKGRIRIQGKVGSESQKNP